MNESQQKAVRSAALTYTNTLFTCSFFSFIIAWFWASGTAVVCGCLFCIASMMFDLAAKATKPTSISERCETEVHEQSVDS